MPAAPKTKKSPHEVIAAMTEAQKTAIVEALREFPEGGLGKRRFAEAYGLPVPPPQAIVYVQIAVDITEGDVNKAYYGPTVHGAAEKRICKEVNEALLAAGFKVRTDETGVEDVEGIDDDDE